MKQQNSFRVIFDTHADDILAITYTYVKDLGVAEDITQEDFTKFWQQQDLIQGYVKDTVSNAHEIEPS